MARVLPEGNNRYSFVDMPSKEKMRLRHLSKQCATWEEFYAKSGVDVGFNWFAKVMRVLNIKPRL